MANNIVATLIAMFLLNPLLNPMFSGTVRTEQEGIHFPSLLSGYFLLTLLMVISYKNVKAKSNWLKKGFLFGLLTGGIVFVSGHMIVAGWSIIPALPMLISGILDTFSTIATGLAIAYIYRNE